MTGGRPNLRLIVTDATADLWQEQAACRGVDPDLFFPERGTPMAEAKEICRTCPVRTECLEHAIVNSERFGVWGGTSERERRTLRAQRNAATRARRGVAQ